MKTRAGERNTMMGHAVISCAKQRGEKWNGGGGVLVWRRVAEKGSGGRARRAGGGMAAPRGR
jgi:hypothetical protein